MRFLPLITRLRRQFLRRHEIWLVDDEDRWHTYINETYGLRPDFDTRSFHSPSEVIQALDDGYRPDLLLIDIFCAKEDADTTEENFDQELEKVGETANEIWSKYSHSYSADGLSLAAHVHKRRIPACLYSAKGAPLFPSSSVGLRILQTMRYVSFLAKSETPTIEEEEHILRLIRQHRVLRRKTGRVILTTCAFFACAVVSAYISNKWERIGDWLHIFIDSLFG
ncbi:MAG: hypothetical protein IH984_07005 [Planctomycetes bacterium]|nr:hypothetical protein [Planctomycetota bacterium]